MPTCEQLGAYLDGALSDQGAFEAHLLTCTRCQTELEAGMQIMAAGAALTKAAKRPHAVIAASFQWRRLMVFVAATAAAAAIVFLVIRLRPSQMPGVESRIAAALSPRRSLDFRLPFEPLDRHRPYDVPRGRRAPELISNALTAEVETELPKSALAAVLIARSDLAQAEAVLENAGIDDNLELDRAALAIARDSPTEALAHLDEVLTRSPGNPIALWNRGIVLDRLRLPLAAAESFRDAARSDAPAWAVEANERLTRLQVDEQARSARWKRGRDACANMTATVPDRLVVRENYASCRPAFYEAVRTAPTLDALNALQPVAAELDSLDRSTAASALLARVTKIDPKSRHNGVEQYARLAQASSLSVGERTKLLEQLRTTHQDDLLLGAIPRSKLPGLRAEYITRALASKDPYYVELSNEFAGNSLLTDGNPLGAEALLRRAVASCTARDVEFRCSNLQLTLVYAYAAMDRPSEGRKVALAALDRSRRLGLYWDERLFFDALAELARLDGSHSLMRAYLREATLRAGSECEQVQWAGEALAVASIDDLHFAQARSEISASPTCNVPPDHSRARVIAELSRFDGTEAEAAELQRALVESRGDETLSSGGRARFDAIEGRLLANRDVGRARTLLRRAIETADQTPVDDADAASARRDAYGALLVLAASDTDPRATLQLFADNVGVQLSHTPTCIVGVMADAERLLVVVQDAKGHITRHFDAQGVQSSHLDAKTLVPSAMVASLADCKRVDVLALPPVFGLPNLLPPNIAWSYRSRTAARSLSSGERPTVLTVADVVPPSDLQLSPLATHERTPIDGTERVDLLGPEATPARVIAALPTADAIEINAHGFVDLAASDASMLALSPGSDDHFTLDARQIAAVRLPKAPLVVLAACHAAFTVPHRQDAWGLPRAFLTAGARAVVASPDDVSDLEAGAFFRAIEARTLKGEDPATALRDERLLRITTKPNSWAASVLLFD